MEIHNKEKNKSKSVIHFRHTTIVIIISTALISSFGNAVYAMSVPAVRNLHRGCISFVHNNNATNLLAADSDKKKTYKINDRIAILSDLTGESVTCVRNRIKNGETTLKIAEEYGVLEEYNSLVLNAYNRGLEKLYKNGKLSGEECADMYNNADISFINTANLTASEFEVPFASEKEDITDILSEITGLAGNEVEELIICGESPYDIAKKYDKLSDFKECLLENLISNIDEMLERNEITETEADNMIADFENAFLKKAI